MIENELYMPWDKITEHFTYTLESAYIHADVHMLPIILGSNDS